MKTEQLTELGLTEEQAKQVLSLAGKDIEKYKNDNATLRTENEDLKTQIGEANNQIEQFKGMDIDGIKQAAADWEQKAKQAETDAAAKVEAMQRDYALIGALRDNKAKNPEKCLKFLDVDALSFKDGKFTGLVEQIDNLKASDGYLFDSDDKKPKFAGSTQGAGNGVTDSFLASARKAAGLKDDKE